MNFATTARRRFALPQPALTLATRRNTAVLKIAANGIEYQAMLALDDRNCASPAEIAAMLERMAGYIRRDAPKGGQ
jgi:hypothetical protein